MRPTREKRMWDRVKAAKRKELLYTLTGIRDYYTADGMYRKGKIDNACRLYKSNGGGKAAPWIGKQNRMIGTYRDAERTRVDMREEVW